MGKLLRFMTLLILLTIVVFVLNSVLLRLLFGVDMYDQLDALTSLALTGSFPGQEEAVSGGSWRRQDDGGHMGGAGSLNAAGDMIAASRSGEKTGTNVGTGSAAGQGAAGESGTAGDEYFIPPDEIASLENMSLKDKMKVVSILSGVGKDVLDSAIQMAGDGITYEEYNRLMDSVKGYLNRTDIETLEGILDRTRSLYAQGGG